MAVVEAVGVGLGPLVTVAGLGIDVTVRLAVADGPDVADGPGVTEPPVGVRVVVGRQVGQPVATGTVGRGARYGATTRGA